MKDKNFMKKIGCIVLVLLIVCISHVFSEPCGDVNSDGAIDILDALLIAQYYVELNPENFDQNAADVNGDGSIDILDALLVARYYVELIPELPGCVQTPTPTRVPTATPNPDDPVGPEGYIYCCDEGESYTFDIIVNVAYGADGHFYFMYEVTGTITFDNDTFGDPIYGTPKHGFYRPAGPTAAFSYSPAMPISGQLINFDASASSSTTGTITAYSWDFGDGTSGAGMTTTHIYSTAGDYQVTLTVTANDGTTGSLTQTVTVYSGDPIARFSISPLNPKPGETVTVDASTSVDLDGTITNYEVNYGDGTVVNGAVTSHQYTNKGRYTITVTVTDNDGKTGSLSKTISVGSDVQFSEEMTYTRIEIIGPSDRVVMAPISSSEGAVGVRIDGGTYWLKGIPETANGNYIWNLDNNMKIILTITDALESQVDFKFNIENVSDNTARWLINIQAETDEYFTGIFERVVDGSQSNSWRDGITTAMNLRGQTVEMHLKPTVSAYAPFYISSKNYGLFVKGSWPGEYDFCDSTSTVVKVAFEGPDIEYSVLLGRPMEVVQRHALQTGPSVVPPTWAFGQWRWRDEHRNGSSYYDGTSKRSPYNRDLVEDVLMMKALDIPLTAVWIDRPWGPGSRGFDDYEFDTSRFPQPENMIQWLKSKDLELIMWIAPFVMGDMADYAENHNYDLDSDGRDDQVLMDFTNSAAVNWWKENGPGKLARMGIKGFKLDRADGEKLQDALNKTTSIGTTYRENFNDYCVQYVKAANEAVTPVLDDDFILFPRAQYTGSAKYGGMWAGDTDGKPEGLRSAVIALQRCAVMGYPLWASDIGGYHGDFSRETCMRWIAFGCFSPLMEIGPTENRGLWNSPDSPSYDTEMLATWRLYAKIRVQLISYLHALSNTARDTGTPIARPLFLEYPDQVEAWNDWQTYKLGNDILVSVNWDNNSTHRLYLPAGEQWTDAWDTGTTHNGGQYVQVNTPHYKMPIFIRQGATIELGDLNALYQESVNIVSTRPNLSQLEAAEGW